MADDRTAALDRIVGRFAERDDTSEVSFALVQPSTGLHWSSPGDRPTRAYFIASTTKLYTTALILQLRAAGSLSLDTAVVDILGADVMRGLHTVNGRDLGTLITVRHLLAHTSGIGNYFEQRRDDDRKTLFSEILHEDQAWTFDGALDLTRRMRARFAPGTPGKAFYSDTNFQLLGRIVERLTGSDFSVALDDGIIGPLRLSDSFLFTERTQDRYDQVAQMLVARSPAHIPRAMGSFKADGGIVSTAADGIEFLRAFLGGRLFPAEYLTEMTATWNRIFPPLQYGVGIMRFALPRILSPFAPAPDMIGHSGASGAVLFYAPELDLYLSGTSNQIQKRSLTFKLLVQLAAKVGRA